MVSLRPAPGVSVVEVVCCVIETCTWSVGGRDSLMVSLRLAPGVSVVEVV